MISAQSIVRDIRCGFTDPQLREKYRVTPDALHFLMRRLVDEGLMTDLEVYSRKSLSESDLMRAFSGPDEAILRCPVCGNKIPDETVGCDRCKSLAEEFTDTLVIDLDDESSSPGTAWGNLTTDHNTGQTEQALNDVCREGLTDLATQPLSQGMDANPADASGMTPLMAAALAGQEHAVQLLLSKGADVNAKDVSGQTALGHAASKGHISIMRILLEKGAQLPTIEAPSAAPTRPDFSIAPSNGPHRLASKAETFTAESQYVPADPFIVCPRSPDPVEVATNIPLEIEDGEVSDRNALLKAASRGLLESVEALLDRGTDVNSRSKYGNTPLIRAAFKGHLDVTKLLLQRHAGVNTENASGSTALIFAVTAGHAEVVELLLRHGANVCSTTIDGDSALMVACVAENPETVASLIRSGADVNQSNSDGDTPLLRACDKGQLQVVEDLLRAGAAVNVGNKHGNTALMKAALKGHESIAGILLKAGADVNAKNAYGNTALMKACHKGRVQVAKLLLEAGAKVDEEDRDGRTAMMRAKKTGRQELIDLLVQYQTRAMGPI